MKDYQKYINALRKCAKEHENDRTSTGHIIVSDLCKDTANLLENIEQEPKWIPVSERLPKENETVLINYYRLNEHSVRMAIWDELHCRFYNSEYTKYVSVDFVTAWMPLPKPYEPQESEE